MHKTHFNNQFSVIAGLLKTAFFYWYLVVTQFFISHIMINLQTCNFHLVLSDKKIQGSVFLRRFLDTKRTTTALTKFYRQPRPFITIKLWWALLTEEISFLLILAYPFKFIIGGFLSIAVRNMFTSWRVLISTAPKLTLSSRSLNSGPIFRDAWWASLQMMYNNVMQ